MKYIISYKRANILYLYTLTVKFNKITKLYSINYHYYFLEIRFFARRDLQFEETEKKAGWSIG